MARPDLALDTLVFLIMVDRSYGAEITELAQIRSPLR